MFRSRATPILILLIGLLIGFGLWFLTQFGPPTLRYRALADRGETATATVREKGVAPDVDAVTVTFDTPTTRGVRCVLRLSVPRADALAVGDAIEVVYLPEDPTACLPADTVTTSRAMFYGIMAIAGMAMLFGLALLVFLVAQFRRPRGDGLPLTSHLDATDMRCPRCDAPMAEGYIPGAQGISWRDRDQAVGLPGPLDALPGTMGWVRRPRMHAFRCEACEIVTLRYGKR